MKEIPLTKGYTALVDDEDFERLACYAWQAIERKHTVYARRSFTVDKSPLKPWKKQGMIYMHTEVLGVSKVDHADGNGLNNQRINLRLADGWKNNANSRKAPGKLSKYKGVTWDRNISRWKAYVCKDHKINHLGYFKDEADAATAYNFAALEAFGEFARFNVPL